MPWYYAGTDSRPVGPFSLEELHARRASGEVAPETYVIEHSGQPGGVGAWTRYREAFPVSVTPPGLPPLPPPLLVPPVNAPPAPGLASPTPPPAPPSNLFPSAGGTGGNFPPPAPAYRPPITPHAAPHGNYPIRVTNSLCAWGFGLAIGGFVLAFACGIGLLLAAPALLLCIIGFVQVQQRREQSGSGLAVAGSILSVIALLISIGFLVWAVPAGYHSYLESSTQQQSGDR